MRENFDTCNFHPEREPSSYFSEIFFFHFLVPSHWLKANCTTDTSHVIMNSNSHGSKFTLNKINSSKPAKEGVLLLFVAMLSISCHTFPLTGHL